MGARMMMGMRDLPAGSGEVDPLYTAYSRGVSSVLRCYAGVAEALAGL